MSKQKETAWAPQAGPQEAAIRAAFVDELFYGGAAGGGKSDYLLGDFAQGIPQGSAWQGVLFRQSFPSLADIVERSQEIYPLLGGKWLEGKHEWKFNSGAVLRFRQFESVNEFVKFQGHCVAEGTPVLMGDNTYRPIEEIRQGDMVMTLGGPRRVQRTWGPDVKDCVDVTSDGRWIQSHPVDHRILTTSSWQSYASLQGSVSRGTSRTSQASQRLPSVSVLGVSAIPHPRRYDACEPPHYGPNATESPLWSGRCGCSDGSIAILPSPLPRLQWDLQPIPVDERRTRDLWSLIPSGGGRCGQPETGTPPSSPDGCRPSLRSCGGQPLFLPGTAPNDAPSQVDAEERGPVGCRRGVLGSTPTDSLLASGLYDHPYTGEIRSLHLQTTSAALTFTPCGEKRVFDLTVEECNHYITTDQCVVNQNSYSWIGWDELPEWPDDKCYRRMISRLRGRAENKRIRATGNPGGVGHGWVQERFHIPNEQVDWWDCEPFQVEHGMWRMFIPSLLRDNKILMEEDPDYEARLEEVGDPELVRAWKEGDWNAIVGAYFGRNWSKVELIDSFEIPPEWPVFAGLDYGEVHPTACLWGAQDYDDNLILFNEYYDIRDSASQHAEAITASAKDYPFTTAKYSRNICDPNFFVRRRVNEAAVNSAADAFAEMGMRLQRGNNNRINGWRLVNDAMSKGKVKIFKEWCPNLIRTLPKLPRDAKRPEDVDTRAEDHLADALRYMMVHIYGARQRPSERAGNTEGARIIESLGQEKRYGRYG